MAILDSNWQPHPKVLQTLEEQAGANPSHQIAVGERSLSWAEVLDEVRRGTDFGKHYQNAFLDDLKRGKDNLRRGKRRRV